MPNKVTQDDLQKRANERRKSQIDNELKNLDAKAVRPLRAVIADVATDADRDKLAEIEEQCKALRDERASL